MEIPDQLLIERNTTVARVLIAKTSLDGHWRGVNVVSRALREGGFEVILAGMATADTIARVAADEDVDLIGLNVGGRVEVVERILDTLIEQSVTTPVLQEAQSLTMPSRFWKIVEFVVFHQVRHLRTLLKPLVNLLAKLKFKLKGNCVWT